MPQFEAYFVIILKVYPRLSRDLYKEFYLRVGNTCDSSQKMEVLLREGRDREILEQIFMEFKIKIRIIHAFRIISFYMNKNTTGMIWWRGAFHKIVFHNTLTIWISPACSSGGMNEGAKVCRGKEIV